MVNYKSEESYQRVVDARSRGREIHRKKALDRYYSNPNYCLYCGKIIEPKNGPKTQIQSIKRKKYCSNSCAAKANNHNRRKIIYCKNCNKEIITWNNRKYCSTICQKIFINKKRLEDWKQGKWNGLTPSKKWLSVIIRDYLLEKANYSCEECGWNKVNPKTGISPVQIHHKDGDYKHNSEDNLQVLCPCCHSLTETFGSRNRGKGRDYRYKN